MYLTQLTIILYHQIHFVDFISIIFINCALIFQFASKRPLPRRCALATSNRTANINNNIIVLDYHFPTRPESSSARGGWGGGGGVSHNNPSTWLHRLNGNTSYLLVRFGRFLAKDGYPEGKVELYQPTNWNGIEALSLYILFGDSCSTRNVYNNHFASSSQMLITISTLTALWNVRQPFFGVGLRLIRNRGFPYIYFEFNVYILCWRTLLRLQIIPAEHLIYVLGAICENRVVTPSWQ